MGSVDSADVFTVLVTGFDAFRDEYPQNPSWEIASRLPAFLPASPDGSTPRVRIVVFPAPVRVNYRVVRALVPTLWDGTAPELSGVGHVDLVLHIGMAGPRIRYALERFGRRDGYVLPDVDDALLGDTPDDHCDPAWPWFGVPATLTPDLDLDDIAKRWNPTGTPERAISLDAGRYLCDFIFFSSLAHLYRRRQATDGMDPRYARSRVAFLHVPAVADAARIDAGRATVEELISAMAASELAVRSRVGTPRKAGAVDTPKTGAVDAPSTAGAADAPKAGAAKWYTE